MECCLSSVSPSRSTVHSPPLCRGRLIFTDWSLGSIRHLAFNWIWPMRTMQELGEWEERGWDSSPCFFPPYVVCLLYWRPPFPPGSPLQIIPSRAPIPLPLFRILHYPLIAFTKLQWTVHSLTGLSNNPFIKSSNLSVLSGSCCQEWLVHKQFVNCQWPIFPLAPGVNGECVWEGSVGEGAGRNRERYRLPSFKVWLSG